MEIKLTFSFLKDFLKLYKKTNKQSNFFLRENIRECEAELSKVWWKFISEF